MGPSNSKLILQFRTTMSTKSVGTDNLVTQLPLILEEFNNLSTHPATKIVRLKSEICKDQLKTTIIPLSMIN